MAISISDIGNGDSTTNDTTLASGATVTASVGDVLLLCIAASNSGASGAAAVITSIADNAGGSTNVYTQRGTTGNRTAGSVANDGATQFFYECPVTTALSNNIVTVTFSANNPQKAFQIYRLQPGIGEAVQFEFVSTPNGGSATTHLATTTASILDGQVVFGMAAIQTDDNITGDSDTTRGIWSTVADRTADGGVDADSITCSSQYKIVNADGTQSWANATGTARESVRNTICYSVIAATDLTITADAGSYTLTGTAATFIRTRLITAGAGSYSLTGTAASLELGKELVAGASSYALTGTAATFIQDYLLTADGSSYVLTGFDAFFPTPTALSAESGIYEITGTPATFTLPKFILADAGSYTLTGSNVDLINVFELIAGSGSYTLTGLSVNFTSRMILYDETSGTSPNLIYEETV